MSSIKLDAVNKYRRQIKYNFFNKKFDAEQKKKSWGEFLKIYDAGRWTCIGIYISRIYIVGNNIAIIE